MLLNIGVLASHRGTVLQAVLDACAQRELPACVAVTISNNSDSGALERAARANVPCRHLSGKTHPDVLALDSAIADTLTGYHCDVVLLAGYMKKLGPVTLTRFGGRILNTHPSLLPRHGGLNMYGQKVHAAVLQARDTVTGVTIHLVESDYDTGPVIAQREVPVAADDSV